VKLYWMNETLTEPVKETKRAWASDDVLVGQDPARLL